MSFSSGAYLGNRSTASQEVRSADARPVSLLVGIGPLSSSLQNGFCQALAPLPLADEDWVGYRAAPHGGERGGGAWSAGRRR